ncbi:MAG: HD domain-containing protein [Treponema sp.]|nr:HD domain-containing protein [Treponema sp.]
MNNFLTFNTDFSIRYFSILSLLLMLVNLMTIIFALFIKNDIISGSGLKKSGTKILVSAMEILILAGAIMLFTDEEPSKPFASAVLVSSIVFTIMLYWGLMQIESVSETSMETIEAIIGMIETNDENLDGHSLHVQNLTMLLYDYLPFGIRARLNPMNLQYAALLLDIGKLRIPRSIIEKKGKLLPSERNLIQRHPEICAKIFETIPTIGAITEWIRYHHERVDGSGYYHLKGNEIPLASRVLAVADTYSAITMERSYRPSLTHENAIAELKLVAGSQLDSEITEIFCSIPESKFISCMNDVRERMKKYKIDSFK